MTLESPKLLRTELTKLFVRKRRRATRISASTLAPVERALCDGLLAMHALGDSLRVLAGETQELATDEVAYRAVEAVQVIVRTAHVALAKRDGRATTLHDDRLDGFYETCLDSLHEMRAAMSGIDTAVMDGDVSFVAAVGIVRELAAVWPEIPERDRVSAKLWHKLLERRI